jgi:hypothetical protein
MRGKIICILLTTLLMISALPVAGSLNKDLNLEIKTNEEQETTRQVYKLKQLGVTYTITPVRGNISGVDFYDYWSASGHTPYMEDMVGKIYLYEDMGSGELSLIIHNSIDNSVSPLIQVEFNLEGVPAGAYTAFSDDPGSNEFDINKEPEGVWQHQEDSDGGIVGGLPTDKPWSIQVDPNFIIGINEWYYQEQTSKIPLNINYPITICHGEIVDQEQPYTDEVHGLRPRPDDNWQQFSNKGNMIKKVHLHVGCYYGGSAPITLSIENPLGTPLTQVTYQATDLPDNTQAWFTFDVPDVNLVANQKYFIVLRFDPGSEYAWSGAHNDPYPQGASSHPDKDWDYAFKTIVDKSKPRAINTPFLNLLENFIQSHPNMFPLLQRLLGFGL